MNICLKLIISYVSNDIVNMIDCNNNIKKFKDNYGISELVESHNYLLSNDE